MVKMWDDGGQASGASSGSGGASAATTVHGALGMIERIGATILGGILLGNRASEPWLGRPAVVAAWRAAYDVAGLLLSLTAARYLVVAGQGWDFLPLPAVSYGQAALLAACVVCYLAARGHYHRRLRFGDEVRQVVAAAAFGLLLNGTAEYMLATGTDHLVVVGTWLLFVPSVLLLRSLTVRFLDVAGLWRIPVVVVGEPAAAREAASLLAGERHLGYEVVSRTKPAALDEEDPAAWHALLRRHGAQLIVLALDDRPPVGASGARPRAGHAELDLVDALRRNAVPVAVMAPARHLPLTGRANTLFVGHDVVLATFAHGPSQALAWIAKACLDVTGAALLLLVLSPLMLAIAAAVRRDGGKALYAHARVGSGGRRFPCLKFRSMVQDSDAVLAELLRTDPAAAAEWAATRKLRNDPRVTRIGRLLRTTSLDELPQLLNVLRLEMSLVGPRPIVEGEIAQYGEEIGYYYRARPGLTGLWQVSGRSDTSYEHRVQLDSWYVRNWSLAQDFAILLRTVPAVLERRGAV